MKDFNFGNYICKLREDFGMSQKELSLKLGLTNKAISKWENGSSKPQLEQLVKLSEIFNVSIESLVKMQIAKPSKKITKIVLTGGPCAGKSTALNWIRETFTKKGYSVVFVSEGPTDLINGGITPWTCKTNIEFQTAVMKLQKEREKIFEDACHTLTSDKVLMVCDRGLMDGKAYVNEYEYKTILKNLNTTETEIRDCYDGVFHLVSCAIGAKEYYSSENNKARYETVEEAAKKDRQTLKAWTGHPHLRVIDNSTNFNDKMKRLIAEISVLLGEPEPYEIERKFLVEMPNIKLLEKNYNAKKLDIIQTYLKSTNGDEIRVRQRGQDGNYIYFMTTKKSINNLKRIEIEKRLTGEEYLNLIMQADTSKKQIRKNRYCFVYKNQYLELDIFDFWQDKAILEIELASEHEEVLIPKEIKVIKEVTNDENYKNFNLADLN